MIAKGMIYLKKELRNIKKFKYWVILLLLTLSSCRTPILVEVDDFSEFPKSFAGFLINKDIYITSIGQAIDVEDFLYDVDYLNLFPYKHHNMLTAAEVPDNGVVLIVIGCSIKGLGDAGITVEEEINRVSEFVKDVKDGRISVINWHIGGMARRGSTSDSLIEVAFKEASLNIFIKYGNRDLFLSRIATMYHIPSYEINHLGEIGDTLKLLSQPGNGD